MMGKRLRSFLVMLASASVLALAVAWQGGLTKPQAADSRGSWWKCNLHTHSLWSDGNQFPELIADWYKEHGYHVLALSDHNVLSQGEKWVGVADGTPRAAAVKKCEKRFGKEWVVQRKGRQRTQVRLKTLDEVRKVLEEPGRFIMVPAEEISARSVKAPIHIGAVNLRDLIRPYNGDSVSETVRVNLHAVAEQRKRAGRRMIAILNHPNFGWAIRAEDMVLTANLRFFEVFNGHHSVRNYGDKLHPSCDQLWDIVLALRLGRHKMPVVFGLATDDAHHYHKFGPGSNNPGRGWIMVRSQELSADSILRAMEAGDFYASTGVVLEEVRRVGDEIRLDIRSEKGVTYKTQFIATMKNASLDSKVRLDAEGKPATVTRLYGPDIGKVVAEFDDLNPRYKLTGNEWYVRARVVSSKPHPNPYQPGDKEMAWTQPFVP